MTTQTEPKTAARPGASSIKRAAVVISVLVILAAGGGTLLGFAARHSWRLELASHFRVQYFWALIAAAVVLVIVRHKILAVVASLLALVNLALILPLYFGPAPRHDVEQPLRAMSLNVHFLNDRYASTLDLIMTERPDFVLLMEVTPDWDDALEMLDRDYPYGHVTTSDGTDGLALLSRHEITDLSTHWVPGVGRRTIVAEVDVPAGTLTLLAAHTASPGTRDHFEGRNRQLEQIGRLARDQSGAVMLLGDLNTTSWSPYFQQLLRESGLRDSRRGFGVEATWPSASLALLRIPIDHCLVSPAVSVLDRWVGPAVGSDHRPILVDFAVHPD